MAGKVPPPFVQATGAAFTFLAMSSLTSFQNAHDAYLKEHVSDCLGDTPHRMEFDMEAVVQNPGDGMTLENLDPNVRVVFEHMKDEMGTNMSSVVVESEDSVSFHFGTGRRIIVRLTTLH
jgi:hypothetical protein